MAAAQPGSPDTIGSLVAAVANVNQELQNLGAAIQEKQESVNKAIVDVQTARDNAAAAQHEVDASRQRVDEANTAIAAAQKRFDGFAAATYINGPSDSYLTASDPSDILDTAAAGQTLSVSSQQVIADLQRARTEQVNKESAARLAKQNADQAVVDAEASQQAAVSALTDAQQTFSAQQAELDRLSAERASAQAKLDKARASSAPVPGRGPAGGGADRTVERERRLGPRPAPPHRPQAIGTPHLGSHAACDPQRLRQRRSDRDHQHGARVSSTSAQVTQNMGRNFLQKLGCCPPRAATPTARFPASTDGRPPNVIRRGMSQLGVPYSWGGGNAAGPSRGIDSGAGTVGFDCSGLMLYMFAGVGIKLPHYSGNQYNAGRKIPSSQMRRGDMIFYGPNASQHVTMYLGNGQMLEAPYTGST